MSIQIHNTFNPILQGWDYDNDIYLVPTSPQQVTAINSKITSWSVVGGATDGNFTLTDGNSLGFTVAIGAGELLESNVPRRMAGGFSISADVTGMKITLNWN